MYKFFYDKYDKEERQPVPNLSPSTCVSHSQLYQVFCRTQNDYVISDNVADNKFTIDEFKQKFLYPIEIRGRIEDLLYDKALDNISRNCIELAKNNQIRFIINYSHEPMKFDGAAEGSVYSFFNSLKKYIVDLGLHQNMFIIYPGTFNLLELEPKLKTIGFRFNYTDTLMLNTASKLKELYESPFFALGYETTLIQESEINEKRNRYFICLNRNSQKKFRFTLGCYFELKNWWDDIYCSFLFSSNKSNIFITNNVDFDKNIISVSDNFVSKMPIEFDTQKIDDKGSFESGRAYKKENGWLDSYIYVCTETEFENNNIFLSEKSFHGVITLQPFILFAPCGHLGYMKKLGFKTFDEFIDEKYDDIEDDKERFIFLCDELNRIHNLSLDTIHEWYLSIKDKLIFNRNHLLSMANRLPFIDELSEELKSW